MMIMMIEKPSYLTGCHTLSKVGVMAYLNFPYFRVRVDDDNFDSSQGS
jgi:hypothetical protein